MTNTDTVDIEATATQIIELAEAGSDMVRITVNIHEAAKAVPEIRRRVRDAGCEAPIIGDFHYNGHVLLTEYPECAAALDKSFHATESLLARARNAFRTAYEQTGGHDD